MEKGQCPTVANWEGGNVRSRKATPATVTTPGQVFSVAKKKKRFVVIFMVFPLHTAIFIESGNISKYCCYIFYSIFFSFN